MALAQESSARLVPDAGGGASRTQEARVSRLAAGAGPAWPRLPRGQAGPSPGGRGPGTRRVCRAVRSAVYKGACGGHNKVKARSRSLRREESRDAAAPESRARPRQPPPAAEGFRLTLKAARIPRATFAAAAERLSRSLPPSPEGTPE